MGLSAANKFFKWIVREPLLHFLVLGAGLFLLYAHVSDDSPGSTNSIVVDEAEVLRLAEQFQRTWMRPPSRQELAGLAEDFVKEEILYREALALGLDQDDLVIALVWVLSKSLSALPDSGYQRITATTWDAAGKLSLSAAYVIGTLACFWLIERTYGYWV